VRRPAGAAGLRRQLDASSCLAGPGTAAHWPIALDTGGYERAPARATLHVSKPPARRAPGAAAAGATSRPPRPSYWG
jgi:hypothetical protein